MLLVPLALGQAPITLTGEVTGCTGRAPIHVELFDTAHA